jgi:hypothetical protein
MLAQLRHMLAQIMLKNDGNDLSQNARLHYLNYFSKVANNLPIVALLGVYLHITIQNIMNFL